MEQVVLRADGLVGSGQINPRHRCRRRSRGRRRRTGRHQSRGGSKEREGDSAHRNSSYTVKGCSTQSTCAIRNSRASSPPPHGELLTGGSWSTRGRRRVCRRSKRASRPWGGALVDVRAILLTHIHLDHAGATGTICGRVPEAVVYVHERGARHLADPSRLLASATRLYGDAMERMWGRFDPVPGERLRPLAGGERISLGGGNSRWHTHPDMRCTM
ncbi:MAG: MBL fold metallo-hydrolase [Acidobacteria bacterium]|nr:MBL fold metallo-hydrolase [Acidobacteriota bacterium]